MIPCARLLELAPGHPGQGEGRLRHVKEALAVERVGADHAAAATRCLTRAFWSYTETCHLLPKESARAKVLPRYLAADVRDSVRFAGLAVAIENDESLGAAAWLPPGAYPVSVVRQILEAIRLVPIAPWGMGALAEARRGQGANRAVHRSFPPHYWLRAIGVDPEHQGHGVGSALLAEGLAVADAAGVGAFLFTSTASNARWYTQFGFLQPASYRPTPSWPETWAMWRPPATDSTA